MSQIDRRQWLANGAGAALAVSGCLGCRATPVTGRKQLMLVPESNEVELGSDAYREFLDEHPLSQRTDYQSTVSRVGAKIAQVAGREDYAWEARVVASDEQNAFCLPGGKIVVYEGILPICKNEAGLAVVMSHEVAHVLARHGGERMSQQAAVNGVKTAVGYALRNREEVSKDIWMRAYGMAATYGVVLPYSRKHELEADHIGLMLMSQAGYDPAEAPRFWMRFARSGQSAKPPEFLSTHPGDQRRASDLEKLLPEALDKYRSATAPIGVGELIV